jgi:hypothetical protein
MLIYEITILNIALINFNMIVNSIIVGVSLVQRIPVNLSFYVYIILKEMNTIASNHNSFKKKWLYDKV